MVKDRLSEFKGVDECVEQGISRCEDVGSDERTVIRNKEIDFDRTKSDLDFIRGEGGGKGSTDEFLNDTLICRKKINLIRQCGDKVKILHGVLLSSPRQDQKIKSEVVEITNTIRKLAIVVKDKIKVLDYRLCQAEDVVGSAELRIYKTQHLTTQRMFVAAMKKFSLQQAYYKDKCEQRIQRMAIIAKMEVSNEEMEEILDQGSYSMIFNSYMLAEEATQLKKSLERRDELLKLENTIKEMRDIFEMISILVAEQGDLINNIEHNVMKAAIITTTAEEETKEAYRLKRGGVASLFIK